MTDSRRDRRQLLLRSVALPIVILAGTALSVPAIAQTVPTGSESATPAPAESGVQSAPVATPQTDDATSTADEGNIVVTGSLFRRRIDTETPSPLTVLTSENLARAGITTAAVLVAAFVGWRLWLYYMTDPWTRDGRVRADVVGVAPDVTGLVAEVLVRDNQAVRTGQVLFQVDRARFELAVQQAQGACMPIHQWGTPGAREVALAFNLVLARALRAGRQRRAELSDDEDDELLDGAE